MKRFWTNPLKAVPALLLLAAYAGAAWGLAGNVQFVIGDVKLINRAGETKALKKGADINEGDRIVTADGASAQIRMVDGGFIAVRPNTDMGFDTYRYSGKEDGTENAIVSLVQGGFRTITGIIGRTNKQNYLVRTATATIGIRGTDHEPMVILAPGPGRTAIAPPGTYDKVNVGIAFIRTDIGTIDIQRNQVGYAPDSKTLPRVLPSIPPFYKPTPAPGPQKAKEEAKDEGKKDTAAAAPAAIRNTAVVDPTGAVATGPSAVAVAAPPVAIPPGIAVTATGTLGATLNMTEQTVATPGGITVPVADVPQLPLVPPVVQPPIVPPIVPPTGPTGGPFAAYSPSNTSVEVAAPFIGSQIDSGSLVAPADLTFIGGGLSSFTDRDIGGGGSNSFSVIGGVTPVTANASNFATTGVQFGRWSSATALQTTFTNTLGPQSGSPTTWMYGPQGYLDTPVILGVNTGPLTGTFNYALDGSTAPHDRQSGTSGTLTSASVTANFTNQTASANLALTVGGQAWSAATTTPVSFGNGNRFFAGSVPGGVANNNLTVSMGAGTPAACPTCSGNLSGAFTGQNYAGAILSYELFDNGNAGGDIVGHAALARTGAAITNGTPRATVPFFVADFGGNIQFADTLSTPGGVLTSYGSGGAPLASNSSSSTTVTCTTCTVTPATNANTPAAPTGVFFGTWDAGTFSNTFGVPLFGGSPHWITGPEAGPLFLANALIGTKSFAFDGGMVTNSAGVTGTVLGTTALSVDFTRQAVGINLDLSINSTAPTPTLHTWNAKTLPGNEAVLDSGKGLGGAAFRASSFNGTGPGLLTVTVDGTTPGNGSVSGQLTGTGLNGAIMSYDLNAALIAGPASPTFEQVNGVAAFLGSTSDVATPYRLVMMSAADPFTIINQPALGFYPNNPTRMLTDAAGNLTQFDMRLINDRGNSNGNGNSGGSQILSSNTSVLTDTGFDPVSGIRWGRWAGGSINITDRIDGSVKTQPLAGSLHWIAGPAEAAAVTLPVSGTFTYVNAGGTSPTDNRGNVGVLNSATLTANFTAQTVDVGVQTTIAGASLGGSATAVPIIQRTAFAAGPDMPVNVSVTCTGACGTTHRGTIVGGFSGAGATGAAMMYSLEKVGGANASITSGVAAFRRP